MLGLGTLLTVAGQRRIFTGFPTSKTVKSKAYQKL